MMFNTRYGFLLLAAATTAFALPAWAEDTDKSLVLALRLVSYMDRDSHPVLTSDQASTIVAGVNQVYAKCKIAFALEDYVPVSPSDHGLEYHPSKPSELDPIRSEFDVPKELVVVSTGSWNSAGGLGADGANAWTTMPGQNPSGAVIEAPVADDVGIVAHELGHYLNLDHVSNQDNLMNPVIYDSSRALSASQCSAMREAALTVRTDALRDSASTPQTVAAGKVAKAPIRPSP